MKPTLIASTIEARINAGIRRAIYIEGDPGCGKTQLSEQIARNMGIGFMPIHAPLLQPEDYGLPHIERVGKKVDLDFIVSSHKFPLVGSDCPDRGILLLDELPQANNDCQKILANLIQEWEVHGKYLKPGWFVIATGNKTTNRAGANRLLSHLSSRMTRVTFDTDMDGWCVWALDNGVRPEVVQFIRFCHSKSEPILLDFDPQRDVNASPRAWVEGVSAQLGVIPPEAELEVFSGDVGEGPASKFLGFMRIYRKLPSPDAILLDPQGAEVPTDPATQYALAGALAHRASRNNFDRIIAYAQRLPAEITVLIVRDSLQKDKSITASAAYVRWCAAQDVLG